MSAPPSGGGTPIENRRQLIEYFAAGNKPPTAWRMGTEHEKFGFHTATLKPLAYDGPDGIRAMLEGMTRFGWAASSNSRARRSRPCTRRRRRTNSISTK